LVRLSIFEKRKIFLERSEEIEQSRSKLPIYFKESEIIEHVNYNLITLICGATGSGKSTQLPQFLFEAGYCE
jgi:ATP-dependent RNA helicase DHX37/DHR1